MGLLSFFKGQVIEGESSKKAQEIRNHVVQIEADLRLDWTKRVYGDGTYSGYNTLKDFYKGKQWSFRKEGGGTMRVYNYCYTVVENMTAFLTNEPPQISSPPRLINDQVERVVAEGRTKILSEIHDDNAMPLVFQRAVRTASINGDAFIFGAIPTWKTDKNGKKSFDRIRYYNVERPESIRPIWRDDNFNEMVGFIKQYRISVQVAKKLFAAEIKDKGFVIQSDVNTEDPRQTEDSQTPMMTVKEYWDEDDYLLMFNADNKIIHYVNHEWGFIPLQHIPNIHIPGESRGTSDIEHELDPQQEYNERASDLADIIKETARPVYWGKNLDNLSEVRSGQIVIYSLGEDGEINAMPKSGTTFPIENYLKDRLNDIIAISGQNQVLYPGSNITQATGRALSVIMQGVNNKISLRKGWWVEAFKELNKTILFQAEQHIPNAKLVIQGYYKTDVFISSVLLRSVSDEINKFQAKIQSLTTTQHNVGVPNPSEEQKLMKEELLDPILATEISKQPGLLHQILQERIAAANQGTGDEATAGIGGVRGAPPPTRTEGENVPEGSPSPAGGAASPVSPEGAIRQVASRNGAATRVK